MLHRQRRRESQPDRAPTQAGSISGPTRQQAGPGGWHWPVLLPSEVAPRRPAASKCRPPPTRPDSRLQSQPQWPPTPACLFHLATSSQPSPDAPKAGCSLAPPTLPSVFFFVVVFLQLHMPAPSTPARRLGTPAPCLPRGPGRIPSCATPSPSMPWPPTDETQRAATETAWLDDRARGRPGGGEEGNGRERRYSRRWQLWKPCRRPSTKWNPIHGRSAAVFSPDTQSQTGSTRRRTLSQPSVHCPSCPYLLDLVHHLSDEPA